jgi:uncharacterized protein YgbK (DUF1537 family)
MEQKEPMSQKAPISQKVAKERKEPKEPTSPKALHGHTGTGKAETPFRLVVLADDFTGALDTGVQFTKAGLWTEVLLWTEFEEKACRETHTEPVNVASRETHAEPVNVASRETQAAPVNKAQRGEALPAEVTVVDTESRHLDATAAYERLRRLTRLAWEQGYTHFYKKTDSTLRGRIGAEMQAMLDVLPFRTLHFLPAYPALGRQTVDGCQWVDGVALHRTEFATEPQNPIRTAHIPDLLADQGLLSPVRMDGAVAADRGASDLMTAEAVVLERPMALEKVVVLHNAREQRELAQAGERLADADCLRLTGGCAGFAGVLAALLVRQFGASRVPDMGSDPVAGTLLLCGSTSEVSLGQIRAYHAAHPGVLSEMLTAQEKDPRFWQTESGLSRLAGWRERLQTDALVMVQSVRDRRAQDSDVSPAMVAAAFGRIAKQLLAAVPHLTLVVFGGDTLFGIMSAMPGSSLCPVAEMVPGLVVNRLTSNTGTCLLVSKAGGFGAPDVLETVMAHVAAYKQ